MKITVYNIKGSTGNPHYYPRIVDRTYEKVSELMRNANYAGDISYLENMWIKKWRDGGRKKLIDPDAAFLGYVNKAIQSFLNS